MTDPVTGLSRGYGFVRFLNQLEQQEAVLEMNGILCDHRPLRVSFATPKSTPIQPINNTLYSPPVSARYLQLALQAPALVHQPTDPNNTTVFVGGLSSPVTEEELGQYFAPFGDVTYVKIPPGKGCGFVQYVTRSSAEQAIERMNGFMIGTSRIRLSWGRSQADKLTTTSGTTNQQELPSPSAFSSTTSSSNSMHLLGSFRPLSPPSSFSQQDIFRTSIKNEMDDDWLLMPNTINMNTTTAALITAEEQLQFLGANQQQHTNNNQWHRDMNDALF
jgi:RNA recognition motif-containing protein